MLPLSQSPGVGVIPWSLLARGAIAGWTVEPRPVPTRTRSPRASTTSRRTVVTKRLAEVAAACG